MAATQLRNVAIIAHVDHGKTTLVDALIRQSETKLAGDMASRERILDSNELERERGITIFSKNAAVVWRGVKINIIDTPGHADFGGEVERVLQMADGALLLIDAQEGPMPQTLFVLKKALAQGLRIIVVINKIDRPAARVSWALERVGDLFLELGATSEQLDFSVVYASALQGKAGLLPDLAAMSDVTPLFTTIVEKIPPPQVRETEPLQLPVVALAYDNYVGKIATGRLTQGKIALGDTILHCRRDGTSIAAKVTALMTFEGLRRVPAQHGTAGDIVAMAGLPDVTIGDTITDPEHPQPAPPLTIEQPTVKMQFLVNTSPFAGTEGQYCTSRNLRERLWRELDTDVALRVEETGSADTFQVAGRGELHLAILIEKMRREGFEFAVSRPEVILREEGGQTMAPFEQLFLEVPEPYVGAVIDKISRRKGELKDMHVDNGHARLEFLIPTHGLFGYRNELLTDSKGTGIMNTLFAGYQPYPGAIASNPHGSLIAAEAGTANTYGMLNAQGRGQLFIRPGDPIYAGLIVGENARDEDLEVNICKIKRLSNMRSKGEGVSEKLDEPRLLTLEEALEYIGDDELVEVTPKNVRLRKRLLSSIERTRAKRAAA
ncbi:MAG: GTP-binding protein TypA/BipA [Parcubacteria group bacterium Gr01-1014_31]|nr:MAG: GTP-binding protein TypA/BipA [Parcubacteria group bacterium Gr01-1014_31]